jgi:cation:H+ antiporter
VAAWLSVARLAIAIVVVVAGAELFFKGLLSAAARLHVSPFVLTLLVSGFELENLAAGIAANAHGLGNAAAGTFLGGSSFIALAVAGAAAVVAPVDAALSRSALAWTAASPIPLLLLALDGRLSRLDGALLVVWFVVAIAAIARSGRGTGGAEEVEPAARPVLRLVGGLALLTVGGDVLGGAIRGVVAYLRVPQSLLGNTAVAASIEAEELGRVAVPAKRGRSDVALANLIGTIVHFIALNAGVIALVRPIELSGVTLMLHLPVAVGSTLLLCALVAWRSRLGRATGFSLLGAYAAYVAVAIGLALRS